MARTRVKSKAPCTNCQQRAPGEVMVMDEDGCCVLCGRATEEDRGEFYWRAKIDAQAEVLAELLTAHDALSGHVAQSMLAGNVLDAARCLVAHHDALVAARRGA